MQLEWHSRASRRQTTRTDGLGNVTSYSYDGNGNPLTTTDALSYVTSTQYDSMGRLTVSIDALGNRTSMTYNAAGLPLTNTDALGHRPIRATTRSIAAWSSIPSKRSRRASRATR